MRQELAALIDDFECGRCAPETFFAAIGRLFPAAMVWGVYPELGGEDEVEAALGVLSNVDLTPLDTPDPELVYLFKLNPKFFLVQCFHQLSKIMFSVSYAYCLVKN